MELNHHLLLLLQTIKRMEEIDLFADAAKLSRTEFRLLREVITEENRGKSIISSELARRLGITRSAISQIVSKLEAKDLVRRDPSPTDRKIAYVRLSDRAVALFDDQCREANEIISYLVDDIGEGRLLELVARSEEFFDGMARARQKYDSTHTVGAERDLAPKGQE